MDLRALRYFVSVAQIGSITRAAQALNVAQPALSRQIRQLEEELGTALFVRHARGADLTAQGIMLLERAQSIMLLLQRAADDVKHIQGSITGRVSLGVPPATGLLVAPELVSRCRAELPLLSIQIREGLGNSLVEWVLDHRLDLALVHNPPVHPELQTETVLTERMVLVMPPASPERAWSFPITERISLREITHLPLILPSLPHPNRLLLDSMMARSGDYIRPSMEIDSVAITKLLVEKGFGATILTYAAVSSEVASGALRAVPIESPPLISKLSIAFSASHRDHPKTQALVQVLKEVVRGHKDLGASRRTADHHR